MVIVSFPSVNSILVVFSINPLIFPATAVAGNIKKLVDKTTEIEFELGRLTISIDERNSIHMKGPVSDIKNIDIKL